MQTKNTSTLGEASALRSQFHTYLLSESAKALTWIEWKKLGGCGLSESSGHAVCSRLGKLPAKRYGWEPNTTSPNNGLTLGQIQDACIVAGREIARFAKDHLNKPDWAIAEY